VEANAATIRPVFHSEPAPGTSELRTTRRLERDEVSCGKSAGPARSAGLRRANPISRGVEEIGLAAVVA
jgi:hypothetical protein